MRPKSRIPAMHGGKAMPLLSGGTVHAISTLCQRQPRANNALQKKFDWVALQRPVHVNCPVSEALSLHSPHFGRHGYLNAVSLMARLFKTPCRAPND